MKQARATKTHRVWTIPILLGVLTLIGLVGALLVDDAWDLFYCVLLGFVVIYSFAKGYRYRRRTT